MNKEHFLTELKIHLKGLPPKKITYILNMYNEKFDKLIGEGQTEQYISKSLGQPDQIASTILKEFGIAPKNVATPHDDWQEFTDKQNYHPYSESSECNNHRPKPASFFIRFCQIVGVLAFNFLFMIWMIFAGLCCLFAAWAVVLVLAICPIAGVIAFFLTIGSVAFFQLFFGTALGGLGLIGIAIMLPLTKYSFRFLRYYWQWTMKTLRGEY
ncbi:DUF1700 domain-containing protein [Vagococcus intermedius]|uniref:DUF1700 domain-containing protein n=1 Tax=Vagococcus intermedius TaxID=2991418 RepID=A0AAF0CV22_9ENTE|nr:DUF1700 domain-containing protein [Vagococcus intermedius]WEG73252.1 DUF1700 domain-containing protein [Vagococcus intermedius]WEG75337.1 DUF1700 domain-containing protein [Vagococcus intermedius]